MPPATSAFNADPPTEVRGRISLVTLSAVILLQSFSSGLLGLVALRWLGFLGVPPVWFLTLLLVGMPVGAVLLVQDEKLRRCSYSSVILIAAGLAVAGFGFFLVAVRFTDVSIGLFTFSDPLAVARIYVRLLATAFTLLPLFIGYGLVELAAYQCGIRVLRESGLVYALNLGGLVLAFLGYRIGLVPCGTSGLAAIGLGGLLMASWLLERRVPALVGAMGCVVLFSLPGLESRTLRLIEVKGGAGSFKEASKAPNLVLYDAWTPHCRLGIVQEPATRTVFGYYDGLYYWHYQPGAPAGQNIPGYRLRLDLAFAHLIRPGDSVAVLGAGGGLQVAAALRAGAGRVYAIEVIPAVLDALSGPFAQHVDGVYTDPRVQLVRKNARRFLDEEGEQLDVIVVASVETYLAGLRELFEPSQVLFTREALASMERRLKPGGILAVSKFTAVDTRRVIFGQVFSRLYEQGLRTRGYVEQWTEGADPARAHRGAIQRGTHYLIVAQKGVAERDALALMDEALGVGVVPENELVVLDEPPSVLRALPQITDDRAFATGMILANVGASAVALGCAWMVGFLVLTGVGLMWLLRRTVGPRRGSASPWLSAAATAVGFNFMTIEYAVVYRMMPHLDVPMDATFLGMIVFAFLAAVGGGLIAPRWSGRWLAVSVLVGCILLAAGFVSSKASFFAAAAAALIVGALFPQILRGSGTRLVRVYVWDAYGALWGGLVALLVPVFLGFVGQQTIAALALIGTAVMVHGAARRTSDESVLGEPQDGVV